MAQTSRPRAYPLTTTQHILLLLIFPIFAPLALLTALLARPFTRNDDRRRARLVFGPTPILNNKYWNLALRAAGWNCRTLMTGFYESINKREDYDELVGERFPGVPMHGKRLLVFLESLFRFDVFFLSFDGWLLGLTPYWRLELFCLLLAGKKIVMLPYGGDAYVYRHLRSPALQHALLTSYPHGARRQRLVREKVERYVDAADCVVPGFMGPEGIGRWDALLANFLYLDLADWGVSARTSAADGKCGAVVIAHAPNHRGFKGSEFVVAAVKILQAEGLQVNLLLMEKIQNDEVKRRLREETDILVEQLVFTGHGLNAIEGMASGLPVVCNLEDDAALLPYRRWSYFGECPLVSASPENLAAVLRRLVTDPPLRHALGRAGRAYAEKYLGYDSAVHLFEHVLDYVHGRRDSLMNLYHPLLGEYNRRLPRIDHPLRNNRLPD